tara:strand:+ start:749 stop:1552 length:804 start_codon:yes stop_codon:yes gene_type:complete
MTSKIGTVTITCGDAGENHAGMEMLGKLGEEGSGFSPDLLKKMAFALGEMGLEVEYRDFSLVDYPAETANAGLLIIRGYLDPSRADLLLEELKALNWDRRYFDRRRGRVLNKLARANLVIVDGFSQEAQYELGQGTIVNGLGLEAFSQFKREMVETLNGASGTDKADGLVAEGNLYDDPTRNGIGYHGDMERRKVIALRLGEEMPMSWQWYHRSEQVGEPFSFVFRSGDLYLMSERAVGNDWRKSSLYTMRHAAGAEKYRVIRPKKK